MDVKDYRKQCQVEIDKAGGKALSASAKLAESDHSLGAALTIAADNTADLPDRVSALGRLQAATFIPQDIAPVRAKYDALLRQLATDPKREIRGLALERLALSGDRLAQKLLREGLEGTRRPLVPAAKAAQLLGSDAHAAARPILRELATNGKGKAREEALRALAHDTKSTALFESVSRDKSETRIVRQIAALSLKQTAPAKFAKMAQEIVLDASDDTGLRTIAMSAIAHTRVVREKLMGTKFSLAINKLASETGSAALKTSIRQFRKLSSGES